jgi:CDP-glycerol glycerophosphotransferase (TagB/SpsB family)
MPSFPDVVIMMRNAAWKFPCKEIVKIGFDHGAYNFKRFPKARYYNLFNLYFMTSEADVVRARARGVRSAVAVGFPKTDSASDGSITRESLGELARRIGLDPAKKTLLFSSTWDGSGMSAIDKWYDRIGVLKDDYNVMATVHSWMSARYRDALRGNPDVFFITDYEILRHIMLADVCIGDVNSLIAEFCLLDKPIVTFRVPTTPRTMPDVIELIDRISTRIDTFEELAPAVKDALNDPSRLAAQRKDAVRVLLGEADGKAGLRAAGEILKLVPELRP